MIPINPKLREQGHGKSYHLFGLRDNNRLALEAPEPVALAAMIALDRMRAGFALHQCVLRDD